MAPTFAGDSGGILTPLDRTLERLGMGPYQLRLLALCGCGWLADNMWLQTIAVILPRVQEHWKVSDRWIGLLSSSIFAGMTLGSWAWGSFSDYFGRAPAFNGTLLVTSVFGLLAGWAPSFGLLCVAMFGLGTGVGGSMPTDGALFLESIPRNKHYLLTGLSFFFSLGSVISAVVGLLVIPGNSCPPAPAECDTETQNTGWRIQLRLLGILTLAMFLARVLLFRLHESARWLVSVGRNEEALVSLQAIAKFNADSRGLDFKLDDVVDLRKSNDVGENGYVALSIDEQAPLSPRMDAVKPDEVTRESTSFSDKFYAYIDRLAVLFRRDLRRTTISIWAIWAIVASAYTIYNVFLPVWLEDKLESAASNSHTESMRDYVIYTLAGCPGSLIGAWLVETRLGYKASMAASTVATALGVLMFMMLSSSVMVVLSSAWVSLMGTLMYAIIYSYTPIAFPTALRGSACGIAAMLSRVSGAGSPVLTGFLLDFSHELPLILSATLFAIASVCMMSLP